MKKLKLTLIGLACILFGCQQTELIAPNENGGQEMKTVTISTAIDAPDTKASIDSQTGKFTWQNGDDISVLATDGKFYTFTLTSGAGESLAEFAGSIPQDAAITSVAVHPAIVEDGADNTIFVNGILTYILPTEFDYAEGCTNVPMVAVFDEGGAYMSFRQIGGVMRFSVKNMPADASFNVTMNDKVITGTYSFDTDGLGSESISAGEGQSSVAISYSAAADGMDAVFNLPVPTGTYNNFKVEITDADGGVLLSKDYIADNTVNRATLLNMAELVLPERQMVITDVWPFFVDARVLFTPNVKADAYALYVDGAAEPTAIINNTDGLDRVLFGGEFTMNSTHSVAVAKVVDGNVVPGTKSETKEFTTGNIWQNTTNVGTTFVSVGWTNVATSENNADHKEKGYYVELFAANDVNSTPIHSMIAFCGQTETFQNCFSNSSWIGKSATDNFDHGNEPMPTALSFGFLEPNTSYWFRVRTLEGEYDMDESMGNMDPLIKSPYILKSERGGCAFSPLFELTTEAEHVAEANEVFYEGFDDLTLNSDFMNMCPGVVPLLAASKEDLLSSDGESYSYSGLKNEYKAFLAKSQTEKLQQTFTMQTHQNAWRFDQVGMLSDHGNGNPTPTLEFNEYAGSLQGWTYSGTKTTSSGSRMYAYPGFGFLRFGRSGKTSSCSITTPPIESSLLNDATATKCKVTVQVSGYENKKDIVGHVGLKVLSPVADDNYEVSYEEIVDYSDRQEWQENTLWTSDAEYKRNYQWYTVEFEVDLKNKDKLQFRKESSTGDTGFLVIGDVKVVTTSVE